MLKLSQRMFLAALSCVAFGGACSEDDAPPPAPVEYTIKIDKLDGQGVDAVKLRCDRSEDGAFASTLAVTVVYPPADFFVRPAFACGSSTRCGYVHLEGLTAKGELLADVDTATTQGVLVFRDEARLPELAEIRATLTRGVDQKPVLNPDGEPVQVSVRPTFQQPESCEKTEPGLGGAGGVGPEVGGAGPEAGGAGGAAPVEPPGGEAGQTSLGGVGGQAASAGAGGA